MNNLNPFHQSLETWQLSFQTQYKNIIYIEDFLDFISSSFSISNHETATIEINPEDIWQIDCYFEDNMNFDKIISQLNKIAEQNNILILELSYHQIEDIDWVSLVQAKFKPFFVGRFYISSKLYQDDCPKDKLLIIIEAARAFGTGEHQTTKSCIEALEIIAQKIPSAKHILDMGTGTGILAIAASKIWPNAEVIGCDIEDVAVEIAKQNALINHVNSATFFVSDGYASPMLRDKKFNLILSNILAGPLIAFAESMSQVIEPEGYVVLSGFLANQAEQVIAEHEKYGFVLIDMIKLDTWVTAIMQKALPSA